MTSDAFMTLYTGLDREGPGDANDVAWAMSLIDLPPTARICDAGCGTGGDLPALLDAVPEGHVTAIDKQGLFVDEVLGRYGDDPRVTAFKGDMAKLKGPFDLIWCAGALYFLGIPKALKAWRPALAKPGWVAFSYPAFFTDRPSDLARAFWGGDLSTVEGQEDVLATVARQDYQVLGHRHVTDAAWERYYQPLEARIAQLQDGDVPEDLATVLEEAALEAATWRKVKAETGYLMVVARPA